jgi:hypothetical protein
MVWIVIGAVIAALLLVALLVDRRDRRGGADRVGRMRAPGKLSRVAELKLRSKVFSWLRPNYRAEDEGSPRAD